MVQKSLFLAISGDGGSWRGLAFHKKWPEENWFCQNRPYCGRTKPRVRKQTAIIECARGGVFGVARGGAEIAVFGDFWGWQELAGFGLPQEVARENWILSKQTLLRSNETSCQETNHIVKQNNKTK